MMTRLAIVFLVALCTLSQAHAGIWGKAEVAGAYLHLDVLANNKTVKCVDLPVVMVETDLFFGKTGLSLRPKIIWGNKNAELFSPSIALGWSVPFCKDTIYVAPIVGITYTYFDTMIPEETPYGKMNFKETFHSHAPFVGLEVTKCLCKTFRVTGQVQFGWSHAKTKVKSVGTFKGKSKGPSYGFQAEYDLNSCWAINAGVGYNLTLSREKAGLRGYGGKIGLVRWF